MIKRLFSAFLPRFLRFRKEAILLWHAFRAPETPLYLKAATLFAAFYLVYPFDILPDFVPLAGWIDDIVIVPLIVSWIVSRLPVPAKAGAGGGRPGPVIDGIARERR